jgi:hypothetical protein
VTFRWEEYLFLANELSQKGGYGTNGGAMFPAAPNLFFYTSELNTPEI